MSPTHTSHLEVERTFSADAATELPSLLGGVVDTVSEGAPVSLSATYFDTADLRLLGAGITLRRREGGDDEGWHVKVAVGSSRLELHRRLTRTQLPPAAVRRLVRGVVRGGTLVPVAVVSNRRRRVHLLAADGRVLAELARDEVTARRLSDDAERTWHELELELVDGGADLIEQVTGVLAEHGIVVSPSQSKLRQALGDQVTAGPAPVTDDSTAGEVVAAYLAEQSAELLRQDVILRAARHGAVHQTRIAARRLRSAVATYRTLFDPDQARRLEDSLRWLGRELSGLRDLQVIESLLQEALRDDDSPVASTATSRVTRGLMDARRRDAESRLGALLDSDDYLGVLDDIVGFAAEPALGDPAARPAPRELRRQIRKAHRRVARRWEAAGSASPEERAKALHAARKASKRLRYACEVAEPVLGTRARRLRRRAKTLASVLGERQDALVVQQTVQRLLPEAAASRSATGIAFALGRVHARMDERIRRLDVSVAKAARQLRTGKAVNWLS
jgi:CHAD domain-containing protein